MTVEEKNILDGKYRNMTTLEIIKAMSEKQAEKEAAEDRLKEIDKEYDFIRLNLIPSRFEEEGIEGMKVGGVGRVSLTGDMCVSLVKEHKDEAYQFFRDLNMGDLIQETINSSTLKAAIKGLIKKGEEIPENLVKVTPFTRASITRR